MREGFDVLEETAAAVPDAGVEECGADARVIAHADGHFFDVCTEVFADVGDFVDEGNPRG